MTKKELLESTVEYYSADTNRRCVNHLEECYYGPARAEKEGISEGCAIGRWMTEEQQESSEGFGVIRLPDLPLSLQTIERRFLAEIQRLHDANQFWDESGLSVSGEKKVNDLRLEYNI